MSGRHEDRPRTHVWMRWVVAAAALLTLLVSFAATGAAGAASKTVKTQLSLSGLASADNPLGGTIVGIHPGDKVTVSAALLPTAGLDKLGLGDLVGNLLGGLAKYQVTADLHSLPGGAANTVLSGSAAKTFTFPKVGVYNFTWSAQSVSLLGLGPTTIALDGNQLAKAGVKLNAQNQYVGRIVVSNNPPKGGISIQLPSVKVAPSVPVLGQLPTISLPGVSLPTVGASVPPLLPSDTAKKSTAATASAPSSSAGPTYTPPGLSVPDLVVPQGDSGGGSANDAGVLAEGSNGLLPDSATGSGSQVTARQSGAGGSQDLPAYNSGNNKTIDLAAESGTPSSQVPVILAILAIIALALVAGTYARLFLIKKQT